MHAHSQESQAHEAQPLAQTEEQRRSSLYLAGGKRLFETCLVLLLMPLSLVLLGCSCLLILIADYGPVLYWQVRTGRHGRPFRMCKLRTMRADAEDETGPVWALPDDPRVSKCGRLLRRFYLDELPQLFHVLTGTMSLVGPRPERPELIHWLRKVLPRYDGRLAVRPGITGWAQVHRGSDGCIDDVARKLAYDLEYVEGCSLWLDLHILLRTVGRLAAPLLPRQRAHQPAPVTPVHSQDAN
jgi:lipopolysaccharide/colanic/teichoic acid biosynthesis glycosyltransferase